MLAPVKTKTDPRPDWDTYFMSIANVVATRGNCVRRKVAAVIVKDQQLISTGYNGTPRGVRNCCEGGCERCAGEAPSGAQLSECICSHAEENAITQAAYHGIAVAGGTLYSTMSPCLTCAKMIINAGIRTVVYEEEYEFNEQTRKLLHEAGVRYRRFGRSPLSG
jgi:dCMP deaminase